VKASTGVNADVNVSLGVRIVTPLALDTKRTNAAHNMIIISCDMPDPILIQYEKDITKPDVYNVVTKKSKQTDCGVKYIFACLNEISPRR